MSLLTNIVVILGGIIVALLYVITKLTNISAQALLLSLTKKSAGKLSLPSGGEAALKDLTSKSGKEQILDIALAKKWSAFCDFKNGHISPVYSFSMMTEKIFRHVISSPDFPFSLMGIIHARHRIQQFQRMNDQTIGAYNYTIAVSGARYIETGAECDIDIEIRSAKDDSVVNVTTMTVLSTDAKKAKAARKNRKELTAEEKAAKVALAPTKDNNEIVQKLGKDHTLKYTAVSGDSNPIHHPTYCKLMGMSKPIMHGVYTLARSVAAVTDVYNLNETDGFVLECAWKLPLPVPNDATIRFGELADVKTTEWASVKGADKLKRSVEFLATSEHKKKGVLPHLRGVVFFN